MVLYLCRIYAGAGNARCCDRTSVRLCASSLQNLAVPQDFYFPVSISWNDLGDPAFDGMGLEGFKTKANAPLLA